jgi:hypothetical protein
MISNKIKKKFIFLSKKYFSTNLNLPTIDFNKFLNKSSGWENECKNVADCLYETGVLVVKDPVNSQFKIESQFRR